MKEKITIGVCVLIYVVLVAIGWNDGSVKKSSDGREYLVFWHTYNDDEEAVLREIIKKWEALPENSKYTVRPVRIPFEGHKEKIRTAVTVGQAPDMARVDWSFVCEMAKKQAAANLNDFGFDKLANQYLKGPLQSCLVNGNYYGIPDQSNCVALFYNRKVMKEVGLIDQNAEYSPEEANKILPRNWDAMETMAQCLIKKNEAGSVVQYPFAMNNTLWWHLVFLHTYGVKVISDDGKSCVIDSPEAVNCMNMIKNLYDKQIEGGGWKAGNDPERGFINGQYAMIFMGPWNLAKFDDMQSRGQLDYGVGMIPEGPKGSSSNIGGTDVVILKPKKDPAKMKKCYEFLTFFTNADNQVYWCEELSQIPINIGATSRVKFKSNKLSVFMKQLEKAGPNPVVQDFSLMEDIVNPEIETILTGKRTPEEALKNIKSRIDKEILTVN